MYQRLSAPGRARLGVVARLSGGLAALALILASCTGGAGQAPSAGSGGSPSPASLPASSSPASPCSASSAPAGTITLYTSVTQGTVDAVVAAFKQAHPGTNVTVFRAATAALAARIAADQRGGRVQADILWLTDPLSIQAYAAQGLLKSWQPAGAAAIAPAYKAATYWGTRFINMVMVKGSSLTPGPLAWHDLADPAYQGAVGISDPGFAGSAFGALGYFAQTTGFGTDFYKALKANGATQVQAPDDVTTGVATGRFKVGMTIDNSVENAIAKGSPVQIVWPSDGAIAMYSPIGVIDATTAGPTAEAFVEFVLSDPGQRAIAATGWEPIESGAGGPAVGGPQVYPDWTTAYGQQQQLLTEYRSIFGG